MAARRPSWRGHLKLSLVTCPVALYSAIDPSGEVHFHLINPKSGHRIRTVTVDASSDRRVERKDLVKGFEVAKGKYVTLTPDEIDAVKLESTKTIDIDAFVPAEEIDRLYWDHPYFLAPDGKLANEPFAVIRAAMERAGQVALARVVIGERERLVALEPRDNIIIATTLRSHDEVRDYKGLAPSTRAPAKSDMVTIASKIMRQKAAHFDPKTFTDRYENALRALIKKKQKGKTLIEAPAPESEQSNVVDLMDALRGSLKGARAAAPRKRKAAASRTKVARTRSKARR